MSKARNEHQRIQRLVKRINKAGGDADILYSWAHRRTEYVIREHGEIAYKACARIGESWNVEHLRTIRHDMEMIASKADVGKAA
ncbi:hypothetical protein [Marinobacter sp.]|uniref:hypothetical protein n=1 Tax=Marinobacter sp. TaxID=50741 RepID=UPI0035699B29